MDVVSKNDCPHENPCGSHGYCIQEEYLQQWKCQCYFWWNGTHCDQMSNSAKQIIQLICLLIAVLLIRYEFIRFIKKSFNLSSILFYFLVILLTCLTLSVKQVLLTSINNQTNSTQTTLCFIINNDHRINIILQPIACLYILIFSINRTNLKLKRCFSLPIPLNYFSNKYRFFYASISIIFTHYLFIVIERTYNETTVITTFLIQLFDVLILYIRYYPILICFYKRTIYSLIFGSIYTWLDYSMMILEENLCQSNPSPLIIDIPVFLSFSYIVILFLKIFFQQIFLRQKKNLTIRQEIFKNFTPEERFLCENLSNSSSFQYSVRIASIYSSMIYLMYYIIIRMSIGISSKLIEIENQIKHYFSLVFLTIPMPNLIRSYIISLTLTSCLLTIQLIILLRTIRTDLLKAYKGKLKQLKPSKYVLYSRGNISFAGYFIGNFIWNFIILMICFILIFSVLEFLICYGNVELLEKIVNIIVPSFLFYLIKDSMSELFCQYIFLQNRGNNFSINNFRFLMIFIHVNYLFDSFISFIFAFLRLLKTWILSIIYMMRFDSSLFGSKFKEYDDVYDSYQAFIYFESIHRNPIMRLFLSSIYLQMKIRHHFSSCDKLRYVNRWKLAYFLIQNPNMQQFRRQINTLKIC